MALVPPAPERQRILEAFPGAGVPHVSVKAHIAPGDWLDSVRSAVSDFGIIKIAFSTARELTPGTLGLLVQGSEVLRLHRKLLTVLGPLPIRSEDFYEGARYLPHLAVPGSSRARCASPAPTSVDLSSLGFVCDRLCVFHREQQRSGFVAVDQLPLAAARPRASPNTRVL